jgi:hypothetical protein
MKKFWKGAVILLIVVAMFFSTTAVIANTANEPTLKNMYSKMGAIYNTHQHTKIEEKIPHKLGTRDTILFESFEDNWIDDSNGDPAPPGWEVHITDYGDTGDPYYLPWHWGQYATVTSYTPPAVPPDGEYQAMVQWSYNHQDEWLITPLLDLDGENCEVTFWRYGHTGSTNDDHYYVKASPSGGYDKTDFTDILWDATALPEGDNHYDTPYTIDLSAYDGQTIRLAWHNEDPPSNDGLWYGSCIDAVEVTKSLCEPSIDLEKYVWDEKNSEWIDADTIDTALDAPICEEVSFKIVVHNIGDCPLLFINVSDHMHESLKFINADPQPDNYWFDDEAKEWRMYWFFPGPLAPDATIEITVIAHVEGPECSTDYNWAHVGALCEHQIYVEDEDTCWVHAYKKSKDLNMPFLKFLQDHANLLRIIEKLLEKLGL